MESNARATFDKSFFLNYDTSMKKMLCVLIVLLFIGSLFALVDGQRLVVPGHWVYESLWKISLELGEVNLASSAPLSRAEISLFLDALNTNGLSKAGLREKERIEDFLNKGVLSYNAEPFTIGIDPSIHLEGYHKSDEEIPWVYGFKAKKDRKSVV